MEWWLQEVLVFTTSLLEGNCHSVSKSHNQRSYRTSVPGCFLSRWLSQLFFDFFFQNALLVKDLPAAQEAPVGVQQVLSQHHRCWSIRARWFFFLKKISVSKKRWKKIHSVIVVRKKMCFETTTSPEKSPLSEKNQFFVFSEFFFQSLLSRQFPFFLNKNVFDRNCDTRSCVFDQIPHQLGMLIK